MKTKKRFSLLWVVPVLAATMILGFYLLLSTNQATTPDQIARKVGLKLPTYQITIADDNLDRTASVWTDYYFEISFDKPLSEHFLHKIETNKNCVHEEKAYKIEKEVPDEWAGRILIYPEGNRATIEYTFRDALF